MSIARSVCLAAALFLLAPVATANATPDRERSTAPATAYRGFDGRPLTKPCAADKADPEALKATMLSHARALVGFKAKMRSDYIKVPAKARSWIETRSPQQLVELIADKRS